MGQSLFHSVLRPVEFMAVLPQGVLGSLNWESVVLVMRYGSSGQRGQKEKGKEIWIILWTGMGQGQSVIARPPTTTAPAAVAGNRGTGAARDY